MKFLQKQQQHKDVVLQIMRAKVIYFEEIKSKYHLIQRRKTRNCNENIGIDKKTHRDGTRSAIVLSDKHEKSLKM